MLNEMLKNPSASQLQLLLLFIIILSVIVFIVNIFVIQNSPRPCLRTTMIPETGPRQKVQIHKDTLFLKSNVIAKHLRVCCWQIPRLYMKEAFPPPPFTPLP